MAGKSEAANCCDNTDDARAKKRERDRIWRKENREKHAAQQREWRAKNKEASRAITRKCYANQQPEVKALRTIAKVAQNSERNSGWDQAPKRYKRWHEWEIEAVFDSELKLAEIADYLGRSYRSVEKARKRYRDRAPLGWKPANELS